MILWNQILERNVIDIVLVGIENDSNCYDGLENYANGFLICGVYVIQSVIALG